MMLVLPDVGDTIDDIVVDTTETVLRHGGNAIIVNSGGIHDHRHIAAILRN